MKTKLEWLQTLPEPYRTQALENVKRPNNMKDSLVSAVATMCCWGDTPQGFEYWSDFHKELLRKEIIVIPWPEEAKWENAVNGTIARSVNEAGTVYFIYQIADKGTWRTAYQFAGFIENMEGIDWTKSLEIKP